MQLYLKKKLIFFNQDVSLPLVLISEVKRFTILKTFTLIISSI